MGEINKKKWREDYIVLCMELLKMTRTEAVKHYESAPDFDMGYNPIWYVTEEMNCEFVKKSRRD